MKASETKLIRIIEGTNQYLVPHFQRPYTWQRKDWDTLWEDVCELTDLPNSGKVEPVVNEHFMGAIVTAPAHSVPEGVTKYLLIDGQQRLTTILLLLAAIRDRARQVPDEKLAARIHEMYLTNRYQEGTDQYKLLPTQGDEPLHNDRQAFIAVLDGQAPASSRGLSSAFQHFSRSLREYNSDQLAALTNAILNRLLLVSIVLERDDNPYAIFESLNAKGQPLSQADLLRNFFFMSIDSRRHDQVYHDKWKPMESAVGRENMEEYIRHFLIRDGGLVKEPEVYFTLKKRVERAGNTQAEAVLDELVNVSRHYAIILNPEREVDIVVRERLFRLHRLKATVCYPFLLKAFEERAAGHLSAQEIVTILDVIENFLVRRYVCGTIRAELNKLFPSLYSNASGFRTLVDGVKEVLGSRNYPSDDEFVQSLRTRKLYGVGEARERAKLILERLEASWQSKEPVAMEGLTIEHIMPQTLSDWWREHLGAGSEETYELYLHTLGNLTLTGYNTELSNAPFDRKRNLLAQSKLSLNSDVSAKDSWTRDDIEERARALAERALQVWPNFAPQLAARRALTIRGATPCELLIMGQSHGVETWQDVLRITLTQISLLGDDVFNNVVSDFPRYVNWKNSEMRNPRALDSGAYYEAHQNAEQIHRLCSQIAQRAGLSSAEWRVETK